MYLYGYEDTFEAYLFFEKNTTGEKKTIMSDEVPTVTFKTAIKPKTSDSTTNNNQSSNTSTTTSSDSSSLKVGKYTLKYGKYVGRDGYYTEDGGVSYTVTITLKADGTYTYKTTNGESESGTYSVSATKVSGADAIYFNNGQNSWPLGVYRNNALTVIAGSGSSFEYQGN